MILKCVTATGLLFKTDGWLTVGFFNGGIEAHNARGVAASFFFGGGGGIIMQFPVKYPEFLPVSVFIEPKRNFKSIFLDK